MKKKKDGMVLKSDVLQIIQNYIRGIQMLDYGTDSGIPQLYAVMSLIEKNGGIAWIHGRSYSFR